MSPRLNIIRLVAYPFEVLREELGENPYVLPQMQSATNF